MKIVKKFLFALLIALFWLAIWQIFALAIGNPLIFPPPLATAERLIELAFTAEFWIHTAFSLLRVFCGVAAAIPAALFISGICAYSKTADKLFSPALTLMRSVPVVSFILIAVFVFDRSIIPSVITFIMIFPVLYENLRAGIASTPEDIIEMASVFKLSPIIKIKRIYLPALKPFFNSALCTSLGLALKAGIAAEVVAYIPDSIGKDLSDAKNHMEPADLLAWTAVIVILGIIIEKAVRLILRRKNDD